MSTDVRPQLSIRPGSPFDINPVVLSPFSATLNPARIFMLSDTIVGPFPGMFQLTFRARSPMECIRLRCPWQRVARGMVKDGRLLEYFGQALGGFGVLKCLGSSFQARALR